DVHLFVEKSPDLGLSRVELALCDWIRIIEQQIQSPGPQSACALGQAAGPEMPIHKLLGLCELQARVNGPCFSRNRNLNERRSMAHSNAAYTCDDHIDSAPADAVAQRTEQIVASLGHTTRAQADSDLPSPITGAALVVDVCRGQCLRFS